MLELKDYQKRSLEALEGYLAAGRGRMVQNWRFSTRRSDPTVPSPNCQDCLTSAFAFRPAAARP